MKRQRESGFVLATLIFFLTALTVLIAVTVPVYKMQAKREQEAELLFRIGEYDRAIQRFQRKFGAWPPSIDALVETNGLRFLRKRYTDPITGKPFRILTINANGTLNGSVLFKTNNPFQPTNPFQQNNPFATQTPNQPGQPQQPQQPGQSQGAPGLALLGCGSSGLTPNSPSPVSQQGQPPAGQQAPPQSTATPPGTPSPNTNSSGSAGQPTTPNTTPVGLGVIGVASDSEETSIMVYNNCQKYNQWEFRADQITRFDVNGAPIVGAAASTPFGVGGGVSAPTNFGAPGAAPGSSPGNSFGQPNQFGQPNSTQPNSPFGFGAPQSPQQPPMPRNPPQE